MRMQRLVIFCARSHRSRWLIMTAELHVKTVKYFKSIERVQDEVERAQAELKARKKLAELNLGQQAPEYLAAESLAK